MAKAKKKTSSKKVLKEKAPKKTKVAKEPKTKKVTKEKAPKKTISERKNILTSASLSSLISNVEKSVKLSSTSLPSHMRFSTGLLVPNLIFGGGLLPAMYSISGMEQSAKSTLTFHQWKQAILAGIPYIAEYDAEGSVEPTYVGNIFGNKIDLSEIIAGDNKASRYYSDSSMEKAFESMARIMRRLPDKEYLEKEKTWVYYFPKRDETAAKIIKAADMKVSKALTTDTHYGVPTDDNNPQGIIFVDSWPSLLSDNLDQDEKKGGGSMAFNARKFSELLPSVVGRLKRKSVILYGVNQLREKPGVLYGSPLYEPGGNALKFYSAVRNQISARAVPAGWDRSKENGTCIEPSIYKKGVMDEYQFKHIKNTKNKLSTPFMSGWMRVWTKDHNGQGRGFDPVFDTFEYLSITKQISGSAKKGVTLLIDKHPLSGKKLTWAQFKTIILVEEYGEGKELLSNVMKQLGISKKPGLRELCFSQISKGSAFTMLHKEKVSSKDNEEDDTEDDDEDLDKDFD